MAYAFLNHGTEFFPDTDPDRATVTLRAPEGTDLEATDRLTRQVEAILASEENIDVFVAEVGVAATGDGKLGGSASAPNQARISVDFLPNANDAEPGERPRVEPTPLTIDRIRERVALIPGAEIEVNKEAMGPPVGAPISVEVSGDDFDEVGALALRVQRELLNIPGVTDLSNNYRVGRPELRLRVDRGAAQRVGLSTGGIGSAVRTAVAGQTASTLRVGEDEYDIVVTLAPEYRDDLQSVLGLRLPGREDTSPSTFPVPLSAVASYSLAGGSGSIQHIDQDLVITISGDVKAGYNANAVQADVLDFIEHYDTPEGFLLQLGGSNEEQENAQAFLGRAFLIAVALIMMVLVTQFDSLSIPVIIMATVLLSLVGVLWGLILTGTAFGVIMTGIGVISLAGVVVNNAIVLLDYVEQLRARGLDVERALIRAGLTRFRPVMLTAITTVLGLVPMALGISIDFRELRLLVGGGSTQFWGPMAVAVIFGLMFATVLTLVMVPTLYSINEDLRRALSARLRRTPAAATSGLALSLLGGSALLAASGLIGARVQAAPVTLSDAYAAAERDSYDLAMADEATVQSRADVGLAWASLSPKLLANATYTFNQYEFLFDPADSFTVPDQFADAIDFGDSEPIVIQPKQYWQGSATVAQTFFNASALAGLLAAYDLVEAAERDAQLADQQIRLGVAQSYYGLATARAAAALSDESLATARDQLELARRQVDAGLADRRALIQAELGVARAEREAAAAREQVIAAERGFENLTGLPGSSEVVFPDPPTAPRDLDLPPPHI